MLWACAGVFAAASDARSRLRETRWKGSCRPRLARRGAGGATAGGDARGARVAGGRAVRGGTQEVGVLLPVDFARMGRDDDDGTVTFLAGWSRTGDPFPTDPAMSSRGREPRHARPADRPSGPDRQLRRGFRSARCRRQRHGRPLRRRAPDPPRGPSVGRDGHRLYTRKAGRHAPAFDRARAPACRSRVHLRATRFSGSLLTAVFARTSCSKARSRCA